MSNVRSLSRQSHFLGTKIRNLRKRNHLTLEDLSARCVKVDAQAAPSVSYLSMIERGKRIPSEEMLEVIAQVFQKDSQWFLDDAPQAEEITPTKGNRGGITGMALEPSFLFSGEILQIAIPELLSQTGTSGRQFAQLLIRAYQEHHQNHFPDLERAAEEVGHKQLGLSAQDLIELCKHVGLQITWFKQLPKDVGHNPAQIVSSYFQPPGRIFVNQILKHYEARLKYDLATHIAHAVLHNADGEKSIMVAGHHQQSALEAYSDELEAKHILHAWRDFECSFFAGALLCPKVPFRQLLDRCGYEIAVNRQLGLSESVVMRRMTAVSPYPHWHYFDAYAPGKLKAVYRGNGIPLPWGNMREVADPCQHWSVFRMINDTRQGTAAQISILHQGDEPRLYCCESVRVADLAQQSHVLCAGIDLIPALQAQGIDGRQLTEDLKRHCNQQGGSATIPRAIKNTLLSTARILNIHWISRGIDTPARLICARGGQCPREPSCYFNCQHQG